jgi:hypothetical protein
LPQASTASESAATCAENSSASWLPVATIHGIVDELGPIIGNQLVQTHGSQ